MIRDIYKHRIVIVDDLEFNVAMLTQCLENAGYEVYSASSGEQGLELIDEVRPDLALLDVKMSGLDGFELCRQLRCRTRGDRLPVILVSALTSMADKTRGLHAGADDFICRPVEPELVLLRVQAMLRTRSVFDRLDARIEELEETQRRLKLSADTDPLTGLHNQRFLDCFMDRELQRAVRYESLVSMVLIDVDRFKRFNDTHGRATGDIVLTSLARILKNSIRSVDLAVRTERDEFVVVLPETGHPEAAGVGERLRTTVEKHLFQDESGIELPAVTVSAGIATAPASGRRLPDLTRVAEGRLHDAKTNGGNRLVTDELVAAGVGMRHS
jgi:two-component system cell cycle response regulator